MPALLGRDPVTDIPVARTPHVEGHRSHGLIRTSIDDRKGDRLPIGQMRCRIVDERACLFSLERIRLLRHPSVHLWIAPGRNERGHVRRRPWPNAEAGERNGWIGETQWFGHRLISSFIRLQRCLCSSCLS